MRASSVLFGLVSLLPVCLFGQQKQDPRAQATVRAAAQTELAADKADHSRWQYKDADRKPDGESTYIVVETDRGSVKKKIQQDGRTLTPEELRAEDEKISSFVNDPKQQAKQRKDGEQDDRRAENMLQMLPDAFLWSVKNETADSITLAFAPNPGFEPPDMEARVFAAMAGEIVVDKRQKRMQTIKGRLIHDVKFGFGLLGRMDEGGTFNVERREISPGIWLITESHVHINGRALLFKTIGEQDDEMKSDFRRTPPATTLEQAANILKTQPTSLEAKR